MVSYSHSDLPRPTATVVPRSKIQTIAQAYHYALAGFHATVDLIQKYPSNALASAAGLYWDAARQATIDPPDVARLPSIIGILAAADDLVAVEVDRRTPDASVAAAEKVLDSPKADAAPPPRAAGITGGGWPWWAKIGAAIAGIVVGRKLLRK